MFNFLANIKKRMTTAPKWNDLDKKQQYAVARKITKGIKALQSGARYKLVSGSDEWQRERGIIERTSEDEILNQYGRGKMLDLARNATRNSSTFNGILKQFDLNVVGVNGGKAIFNFDDSESIRDIHESFASWTRDADFFDGLNLNTLLKIILKTYILGGDMILLFDDGLIEDSGKLLLYEPDEIGNTTDDALAKYFGKNARQSLGRVYNQNGRFIGAVVSRSQRGNDIFAPEQCYFLSRNPDSSDLESLWLMPRNIFRIAQGRGTPPLASSLATTIDLEDLCSFELAAAKKNAQTLAQVLQASSTTQEDAVLPSAFDSDTDFSSMSDDEIAKAVQEESQATQQTISLDKVVAAGAIYQVMPEGYKLELLDTKHPNNNMPDFIRWLAGRTAAPFGLSEQFATLASDGASFRAEQLITWPAFYEAQHFLEQICDWIIYRWMKWNERHNRIDASKLGENWLRRVSWMWPKMDELDEVQHQNAIEKKITNMTGSYREILGADWKEKLEQIKDEIDWFKKNNLPHPAYSMVSGGERTGADTISNGENNR